MFRPASTPLSQYSASIELGTLQSSMAKIHLKELFANDSSRFDKYNLEAAGLFLDYSKHLINDDVMNALVKMADQAGLSSAIEGLCSGEKLNNTENRAVLHTALRSFNDSQILIEGQDVCLLYGKLGLA